MRETRKEVLVVGAGPVGLFTALALAEVGVEVKIIDAQNRTTARSYACALHPRILDLLDSFGLAAQLISQGRKVDTVAFYEGPSREAEFKLTRSGCKHPFLLIVPQNVFEDALEDRLNKAGVEVDWNQRLDSISRESESVCVSVQELSGTTTGYIVPHWETTVRRQIPIRAQFIVGADGHKSLTRHRLEIQSRRFAGIDSFAAFEFDSDRAAFSEVRVVLDERTTNVLWPLPGNKWRWTFEIPQTDSQAEFPDKERRAVHLANKVVDERTRDYVQAVAARRAPWFQADVKEVTWCTRVSFEQSLVERYGDVRCWLAGDAAHQTGPVGVQSMNAGLLEGEMLARTLREIIHGEGDTDLLQDYNKVSTERWNVLLGAAGLKANEKAAPWVSKNIKRLIPCIPGLDQDFLELAGQIGLTA